MIIQIAAAAAAGIACFLTGDPLLSCYILGACILVQLAVSFGCSFIREKRLEELTSYLMKVQDRLEIPELSRHNEGQLGILQSEIYKLVVLLKEQSSADRKDKEYFAKMLSDISHQIKTPLTSIMIMTDLLKNPALAEEKQAEFIEKIDSQVSRITWLIRNLLALSQMDADMLKLKKETVNMSDFLNKACQPFELMAEVKGVSLIVSVPDDIEWICDSHWTLEAVSNIIKNCIEHTGSGGTVELSAQQSNFATSIWIRDNGEGMAQEELERIFDRFYKGADSSKESVGIGLAMAKQVIMMQNGVIRVSSEKGKGTEFCVKMYWEM